MKISPQIYVRGSIEAVEMYCKAFDAKIRLAIKDETGNAYAHCELEVDGELFIAVSELPTNGDTTQKQLWQPMAFNAYDMVSEEKVRQAFDILSKGGTVIDPLGAVNWNPYCANVIDKYNVFWWIAI